MTNLTTWRRARVVACGLILGSLTGVHGSGRVAAQARGAVARADTARLRATVADLARTPRMAGDAPHKRALGRVLTELAGSGWDTLRVERRAYVPYPRLTALQRTLPAVERAGVGRVPLAIPLVELGVGDDSVTYSGIWPTQAAYSGVGRVEAPLVYVAYGRAEDWRTLDSLRVDPRGSIAVLRLGACSPSALVAAAERRGASAVVLYADPLDDGYVRGDYYPDGRYRHPDGMRRVHARIGIGDAATDGTPDESRMAGLPRIPVVSAGYRPMNSVLSVLRAPNVPDAWQGGLPFRYHAGLGEGRAEVIHEREVGDSGFKVLASGLAEWRGRERPDEVVLLGAHLDALGPGAVDNASGVAAMVEVARLLRERAATGWRPARTVRLALWDGGEWGQIGAVEYLGALTPAERAGIVAYLDLESVAAGGRFVAEGSPLLETVVGRAVREIAPWPGTASTLRTWRTGPAAGRVRPAPATSEGGVLLEHFGIPSVRLAFEGADGVRHTGYDTYRYAARFADPTFEAHATIAELAVHVALQLDSLGARALAPAALVAAAREALVDVPAAAPGRTSLDSLLTALARGPLSAAERHERSWLDAGGPGTVPWSLHGLYGTDGACGDRMRWWPRWRDALEQGDDRRARAAAADLGRRWRAWAAGPAAEGR